jgi:phosphoglycolate phosphatase-like HAD superfamily hydrolase
VVQSILQVHQFRKDHGLNPGELVILSSRPGRLMEKLVKEHGLSKMSTVRASRVDYYTQHDIETWIDNLGSLGLEGENCVFVNLAAVAGPDGGRNGLGNK